MPVRRPRKGTRPAFTSAPALGRGLLTVKGNLQTGVWRARSGGPWGTGEALKYFC